MKTSLATSMTRWSRLDKRCRTRLKARLSVSQAKKSSGRASMSRSERLWRSSRHLLVVKTPILRSKSINWRLTIRSSSRREMMQLNTRKKRFSICRHSFQILTRALIRHIITGQSKPKTLQKWRPSCKRLNANFKTSRAIMIVTRLSGKARSCSSKLRRIITSVICLSHSENLSWLSSSSKSVATTTKKSLRAIRTLSWRLWSQSTRLKLRRSWRLTLHSARTQRTRSRGLRLSSRP